MKRSVILTIMAGLLAGAVLGFGVGYITYAPQIRSYQSQVSDLTSEVASLTKAMSSHDQQILTLQSEISGLETDLGESQAEVIQYREQAITLSSTVSSLCKELDDVLDITVIQHYYWLYKMKALHCELTIPLLIYVEYLERPRPELGAAYVDMAKDPNDDPYVDKIIEQLNGEAPEENLDEFQRLQFTIAFIQSLLYTSDMETTSYDEYPRYPIETLFNRGGDCEDTAILAAALLDRMGYDVAMLWLEDGEHMALGVALPDWYGIYYEYDSKRYYYLETTIAGWILGTAPPDITVTDAYVYPLGS